MSTSGSNGEPKGVKIDHQNICAHFTAAFRLRHTSLRSRHLNCTSTAFDGSVIDILGSLVHGNCVILETQARLSEGLPLIIDFLLVTKTCLSGTVARQLIKEALTGDITGSIHYL